ncbi:MAG: insulinase family protein [Actinobacteria bacterium]|nr:insulinase family protein [Actinomycetota bacterium]
MLVISVEESVLDNGLPLVQLGMSGTRAVTLFIAFDAGTRTEHEAENGIAHFLEHLVFKGGESYPTYRDVMHTAERLGAQINAFTTHDVVAFHVNCRSEVIMEAADLLTDYVGRARIDADELERERGVVIQEIARNDDQPPAVASDLLGRAAYGDHPLGRPVLGPNEHLKSFSRDQVVAFRERRWAPERGPPFDRRVLVEERETHQSHLRLQWDAPIDPRNRKERAALIVLSTLFGGSMGSRLFEEIRERRGLCYSIWSHGRSHSDTAALAAGAGLDSDNCVEAYERIVEMVAELAKEGPTDEEVDRARAYAAGSLVLALERTMSVAGRAAERKLTYGEAPQPEEAVETIDAVTQAEVREIAGRISGMPTVACVGPHSAGDFA